MAKYHIRAHEVDVQRVTNLAPILTDSQHLLAPSVGIGLVLENGRTVKWLSEPNVPIAEVGDFFVTDEVTHTTCLVPATKVGELFEAEQEK
jgi:hypothetical protein